MEKKIKLITTLTVLASVLFVASCGKVQNTVTVINNSGMKADRVTVTVCGQDLLFLDLDAGEKQSQKFIVTSDSGFIVSATLNNGTVITHGFGYVTGGAGAYGNHAEIEITPEKLITGK